MNKRVFLFLALILLLSGCAAPQVSPAVTTGPANPSPEATAPSTELPPVTVENPANYVMISIGDDQGNYVSLTAYENEFGEAALHIPHDHYQSIPAKWNLHALFQISSLPVHESMHEFLLLQQYSFQIPADSVCHGWKKY